MDEEGEDYREKIASLLYPDVDRKGLSRQIFELVKYGGFSWSDVMAMPITTRRRMHFLLTRYNEREIAASKGKTPPPVEMEDQISEMSKLGKFPWEQESDTPKKLTQKDIESEREALPDVVKQALKRLESDQAKKEKLLEPRTQQKRAIVSPEKTAQTQDKLKPVQKERPNRVQTRVQETVIDNTVDVSEQLVNELPSRTLKEESERLKYRKVEVPNELRELLRKKQQS